MTEHHDGCLDRSASDKEAGAIVYLMEELGDARMRCDQLIRGLSDGLKLVEQSSNKDHFYEIAGHLIQGVPMVAFKLQKALDAVALAAGRIDHEELKRSLRPEKVLELERVLEDVRIQQVQHRSGPFDLLTPRFAAEGLRRIAWMTRGSSGLPQYEMARLIQALEAGLDGDDPSNISEGLDKLADAVEEADGPDRVLLASTLRRMLGDSLVRDFNDTEQRTANMATTTPKTALSWAGGKLSEDVLQLADEKEVAKKFKAENPDMTDDDLKKVVEQWNKHKDSLKAASWKTPTAADINVGRLERMVDTTEKQLKEMKHSLGLYKKDPAKYKPQLDNLAAAARSTMSAARLGLRTMGHKLASDDEKESRFEEGKPADPTKNMTPEDKKKWEQANEDNKDKFKKEAGKPSWQQQYKAMSAHPPRMGESNGTYYVDIYSPFVGKYLSQSGFKDADKAQADLKIWQTDHTRVVKALKELAGAKAPKKAANWKAPTATDDEKASRFEEGKPADPTENMTPEDKKKWEQANEDNKDKFKAGAWKVVAKPQDKGLARIWMHLNDIASDATKDIRNAQPDIANTLRGIAAQAEKAMKGVNDHDKAMSKQGGGVNMDGDQLHKNARSPLPAWSYTMGLKRAFIDFEKGKVYDGMEVMVDQFANLRRAANPAFDDGDVREGEQIAKRLEPLRKQLLAVMIDADNLFYGLEATVDRAKRGASWKVVAKSDTETTVDGILKKTKLKPAAKRFAPNGNGAVVFEDSKFTTGGGGVQAEKDAKELKKLLDKAGLQTELKELRAVGKWRVHIKPGKQASDKPNWKA